MTDVAFITAYSWRNKDMQVQALPFGVYEEHEVSAMLRPTTRKDELRINVLSFACIADNEKDARKFAKLCRDRDASIRSHEENKTWSGKQALAAFVYLWGKARRVGAAKAGGEAKARKSEQDFWVAFAKIADRWHLPAKGANTSAPLLAEAGTTRNTVKAYLSYTREEWRRLTQAKRDLILKKMFNSEDARKFNENEASYD